MFYIAKTSPTSLEMLHYYVLYCSNHKWPTVGPFFPSVTPVNSELHLKLNSDSYSFYEAASGDAALAMTWVFFNESRDDLTRPLSREPFSLFVWLFGSHRVNASRYSRLHD